MLSGSWSAFAARQARRAAGLAAGALVAAAGFGAGGAFAQPQTRTAVEAVDPNYFRVCADPDNMPLSNKKGEGFENKIAELFAEDLGKPLVYTWWPQITAYVRRTLNAKKCDVIMGVPAGNDKVLNTNPYFRTAYVMAYRKDSGITAQGLDDPQLKGRRIGVVAGTPPSILMAEYGLLKSLRGYELHYDPHINSPPRQMMDDLKAGKIDVALLWGAIAAWHAEQAGVDVEIIPLKSINKGSGRVDYRVTMGVRLGERDWKRQLNELIRKNQDQIDAILRDYGVPLLKIVGPPEPKTASAE